MNDFRFVRIYVDVDVNPTEDANKVAVAVKRVLGDLSLQIIDEKNKRRLIGNAEGLECLLKFQELLKRERIRDAARALLTSCISEEEINFCLNKQVAYMGHISFSQSEGESPLGPIRIKIVCDQPRQLIEWLTAKT
ncbi:MAG: RNA-binding domain-containing protein [Nitrososphaerota archaeon]|nr:hypothetical protein [Candidatus Bathyarchaeota archaeon]MDW8048536.1 RNA-binding domain-containing protein [Nitrososphaerota archaeon]